MPIYHITSIKRKWNNCSIRYCLISPWNLLYWNFSNSNDQKSILHPIAKTKQKNTTRQYTARFQYLHKISNPRRDEGIILQRKTLHCLWVPAHRQPKTFSQYKWSRILFCGTEWRKWWSKTAFVYKNLNLISRSERTNYELPTYRDDYFLRRLKLQSYPEAVRFP